MRAYGIPSRVIFQTTYKLFVEFIRNLKITTRIIISIWRCSNWRCPHCRNPKETPLHELEKFVIKFFALVFTLYQIITFSCIRACKRIVALKRGVTVTDIGHIALAD